MARIAGVNIPTNKRVLIGLQYIHGIGPAKAGATKAKNPRLTSAPAGGSKGPRGGPNKGGKKR